VTGPTGESGSYEETIFDPDVAARRGTDADIVFTKEMFDRFGAPLLQVMEVQEESPAPSPANQELSFLGWVNQGIWEGFGGATEHWEADKKIAAIANDEVQRAQGFDQIDKLLRLNRNNAENFRANAKDLSKTAIEFNSVAYGASFVRPGAGGTSSHPRPVVVNTESVGKTVIGSYPDYINLADKLGANRFSIPIDIWNGMTKAEQWTANMKFLDRVIARGDEIILSNNGHLARRGSGLFEEIQYLFSKGFRLSDDGLSMLPRTQ
jgi:hypothetical protein